MKNIFTFFALMAAFSYLSSAQIQVPNGGFETWTDSVTCDTWNSLVIPSFPNSLYLVHRSTIAHSGSYATKIETKNHFIFGDIPGVFTLGQIDMVLLNVTNGFPITDKPTKLLGYYKYSPASPGDTMGIMIYFTKWNTSTYERDTLSYDFLKSNATVSSYTLFQIPITYLISGVNPDTMNIVAVSSAGFVPKVGSTLYIDDLSFDYTPVGINESSTIHTTNVYPNPSTGLVNIDLISPNSLVKVYNIVGEEIFSANTSSKNFSIDLSKQTNGIYLLEVNNGISKQIQKLVISK